MKKTKEVEPTPEPVEPAPTPEMIMLGQIADAIYSADDFLLSYLQILAILDGGECDVASTGVRERWSRTKIAALTRAVNLYTTAGKIKKGKDANSVRI